MVGSHRSIAVTMSLASLMGCGRSSPTPASAPSTPASPTSRSAAAAVEQPVSTATTQVAPPISAAWLEALAEAFDDPRAGKQIVQDNALIDAALAGDVAKARMLVAAGARVNAKYIDPYAFLSNGISGNTALMRAAESGNAELVRLLLDHGAEVNHAGKGRTALYFAAVEGHDAAVKLLQDAGAEGDPKRFRVTRELIRAACKGFEMGPGEGFPLFPGAPNDLEEAPEIDDVLKRGAGVDWADENGYTPLMYAANLGLVENVMTLLAYGADANRKSNDGETALSLAERPESSVNRAERRQVVEILKRHGGKL